MSLAAGLILARFAHYLALTVLFGASLFPIYGLPTASQQPTLLAGSQRRLLICAGILALVSGLAWLALTAATMSGDPGDLTRPGAVWAVVTDVGFGRIWAARLVCAAAIVALTIASASAGWRGWPLAALSGGLLASIAFTGHGPEPEGGLGELHIAADALHLLAAGAWLGGLIPLSRAMAAARRARGEGACGAAAAMLGRFSGMGYIAVGVLAASGLVNGWLLLGGLEPLITTTYGRVLLAKLALFAVMILAAAINRFWVTPALERATADDAETWLRRIRRHIVVEQVAGAGVLAAVALLGTLQPAALG